MVWYADIETTTYNIAVHTHTHTHGDIRTHILYTELIRELPMYTIITTT